MRKQGEEVSTGNLRATAMSAPLPGFMELWTHSGGDCNRANTRQIAVIPLNKCVADVMELTKFPFSIISLYDDGGVKKLRAQGYSKSNCSPKPKTPAKLRTPMLPFSVCAADSDDVTGSVRLVYKKYPTNHPSAFTFRSYPDNKCSGSFVQILWSNLCDSDTNSSAIYDCALGTRREFETSNCAGAVSYSEPIGPMSTAASACQAASDGRRGTEKFGCTSRGPVAVAAASSQFAAAEAVESD